MVGDGADTALGGASVGKDGHIGHAEELFYLRIPDVVRKNEYAVFSGQGVDDGLWLIDGGSQKTVTQLFLVHEVAERLRVE